MAERVRQDIEWLDRNCDWIMVVAHSQGSAVAWQAIRATAQRSEGERGRSPCSSRSGRPSAGGSRSIACTRESVGFRQFLFAASATASTLFLIAGVVGYFTVGTLIGAGGDLGGARTRPPWPSWPSLPAR